MHSICVHSLLIFYCKNSDKVCDVLKACWPGIIFVELYVTIFDALFDYFNLNYR